MAGVWEENISLLLICLSHPLYLSFICFPGSSAGKESACSVGVQGLIPGLGRYPGEGNGKPLQYLCLENPINWGAWQAAVHAATKSQAHVVFLLYIYIYIYK